jgi:hypothetical protein
MKRLALPLVAVAALALGCQENQNSSSAQNTKPTPTPSAQTAGSAAKPTAAPSAKEYYEVTKNGKTYVFSNLDATLNFRSTGALPAEMSEKPNFGPKGETVVFQTSNNLEPALIAEYQKAHPKK